MVYTCFVCNKRSDKLSDLSFHRFPSNTFNRQKWLDIIGKSKAVLGKGAAVCSSHFESECFRYGLVNGKKFLKSDSKPTLNLEKHDKGSVSANISNLTNEPTIANMPAHLDMTSTNTSSFQLLKSTPEKKLLLDSNQIKVSPLRSNNIPINEPALHTSTIKLVIPNKRRQESSLNEIISIKKIRTTDITWEDLSQSPSKGKTLWETAKQELLNQRRKIECLQRTVRRLKQKVSSLKLMTKHLLKKNLIMENEAQLLHSAMDPVAETLFKQILTKKKKVSEFPIILRSFAATLLFLSPKAYTYVRKIFSLSLPHPSTVRKWFTTIDGKPGISKSVLQALEGKLLQALEKEKALLCSLTVDDMSIKKHLHWNGTKYTI